MNEVTNIQHNLSFNGAIMNLLGYPLNLQHIGGQSKFLLYPPEPTDVRVTYREWDHSAGVEHTCQVTQEAPLKLEPAPEPIGLLNDVIRLIRPAGDSRNLRDFWLRTVRLQHADVTGFPDMKSLRKEPAQKTYVVASASAALVAHFKRKEELDFVLIPAIPIDEKQPCSGYQALLPARYLIENDPLFYQYDPTRHRPEYEPHGPA